MWRRLDQTKHRAEAGWRVNRASLPAGQLDFPLFLLAAEADCYGRASLHKRPRLGLRRIPCGECSERQRGREVEGCIDG
jgi:hypothetical protein